jgi:hypothetical protein
VRRASLLLAILAVATVALAEERLSIPILVTGVSPGIASPDGGSHVAITGFGFVAPVRVFFEMDDGTPEAVIVSLSPTRLEILTPPVPLGPGEQMRIAKITVDSRGYRASARDPFVFENPVQQPKVLAVTPNAGRTAGGTRVSIFGEGFQPPVQVLFGDAEARVINVTRSQLLVESPEMEEPRAVSVTVRNINSGTEHTLADAYRYLPDPRLLGITPDRGPAGTYVMITGEGFDPPVAVSVAGVAARVLAVSERRIHAITGVAPSCDTFAGPVEVINIATGDSASGAAFTYVDAKPAIAAVNPRVTGAGKTVTVQLENPGDYGFRIGGMPARVLAHEGSTYRLQVPTALRFATGACLLRGIEGTGPVATRFDLRVSNLNRSCTAAERVDAWTIAPPEPAVCTLPPRATLLPRRSCSTRTVTIANERGSAELVIRAPESVQPRIAGIRGGEKVTFTIAPPADFARLKFETNDPRHPWLLVCVSP